MKKIILVIGVLACIAFIIYGLAVEPSTWFQTSSVAWIAARLIVFVISLVLGSLTYFGGDLGRVAKELKEETNYVSGYNANGLPKLKGVKWLFASAPMLCWILCWVIGFQVMVTFWISEWCKNGF